VPGDKNSYENPFEPGPSQIEENDNPTTIVARINNDPTLTDTRSENIMVVDPQHDTLSTDTILNDASSPKTYSQALTEDNSPRRKQNPELTTLIDKWTNQFRAGLAEAKEKLFDTSYWTCDKIIAVLDNPIDLRNLIEYKIQTRPTLEYIPQAIKLKFQHKDRADNTDAIMTETPEPNNEATSSKLARENTNIDHE
ncbi:3708_t:CDS:2, partial [Gigaspora rosea]